ncbi:methyl-accepting chemotaxis protein [Treponema rectale]|uniref:Methyl-accepting chemotaxis protein n=1 Tax=Treponema rectale TaxID=744512 RepID=A0A840SCT1_9SPIR|nr:methyl-accepting chemotaxis protein [Treponema rectale]MBB5219587.1 methyl-accepting chemotaxis protein [Treponema rectale]
MEPKKKSIIRKIVLTTGIVIVALFVLLVELSVYEVNKSSKETADNDLTQIAQTYAKYVTSWIDENINHMEFYTNADVVYNYTSPEEIAQWLATTPPRRTPEIDYVLFIDAQGNSYYDSGKRGNNSDRAYYKAIMSGDDYFIADPTFAKATGKVSIMIAKAAYSSDGKKIGMFVGVKTIDKIQSEIHAFTLGEKGYAFMLSGDGTAMCHPDSELQMQKNFLNDSIDGHLDINAAAKRMLAGETGNALVNSFVMPGESDVIFFAPVNKTRWSVGICIPKPQLDASANSIRNILVISNIIIAIVILLIIISLMLIAFRPLKAVGKSIAGIASGNADLTQRIEIKHADEIGSVGIGFNKFIMKLQEIISQVKDSKKELVAADENLQASTQDTETSIKEILGCINQLKEIIRTQNQSVDGTATAVTEITSNIQSLEHMIQNQSSGVTQASAATEQMIGNISAINTSIEKMASEFNSLQQKANLGSSKQQTVNEQISEIETQSTMLQEANVAISAIAEQTNLLAMNAAIEAAHAGDAGKGFAVVADEIRKLSETSSAQSKTIGDQLQKIMSSIQTVVTSSSESSEAFVAVSASIKETDELVRQIKSAMEEQAEGSKQVLDALQTMSDSTSNVKAAAGEMSTGSRQILSEVAKLKDNSGNLNDSVGVITASATKIEETGNALTGISAEMNASINRIGKEIDQFKV